jgi:hypothetical protein
MAPMLREDAMNRIGKTLVSLLAVTMLLAPGTVFAQDEIDDLLGPDDEIGEDSDDDRAWGVNVALRSVVGQGTFARVSNDTEWAGQVDDGRGAFNRWNLVLSLNPTYEIGDFTLGATLSWVQWLTPGGGNLSSSVSGGANEPYQFRFQDIGLDADWRTFTIDALGINATPSLSVRLPTNVTSRMETLLFDAGLNLALTRTFFDKLTLMGTLYGAQWFHEYTSPVVDIDVVGHDNVHYRAGGAEDIEPGRIAVSGRNIQYQLSTSLGASLSLPADFSATISYGLHNYWTYDVPNDDEFMSEHAKPGRGWAQTSVGSFGLSYRVNEWMSTSVMATTLQSPKTSDNKSFRFPFWNFSGAASNSSGVTFMVSGSY